MGGKRATFAPGMALAGWGLMNRFPPDGAEQFAIGNLLAFCPACKCAWFLRKMVVPGLRSDVFVCAQCNAETYRTALVDQITQESVRRSQEMLARSRAFSRKPPEDTGV
jgi:hypothetical protein